MRLDNLASFEMASFCRQNSKIDLNECNLSQQTFKQNIVVRHFEFMTQLISGFSRPHEFTRPVVACEQALRGDLAAGREKEGETNESAHRKRIFLKPLSRVV